MRKFQTFVNENKLYILWRTKVTNFRKVMKLSQITVLKLRTIFLKLCQNNYMHEIFPIFDFFLHFTASDSVEPIQPGDTSNVGELPTLPRGSLSIKMFKSVARFVNAAIKQNPRLSVMKVMKLSQITVLNLRTIFLTLRNNFIPPQCRDKVGIDCILWRV